jgi:hypothetical protein
VVLQEILQRRPVIPNRGIQRSDRLVGLPQLLHPIHRHVQLGCQLPISGFTAEQLMQPRLGAPRLRAPFGQLLQSAVPRSLCTPKTLVTSPSRDFLVRMGHASRRGAVG